jgi:hypothetical protein
MSKGVVSEEDSSDSEGEAAAGRAGAHRGAKHDKRERTAAAKPPAQRQTVTAYEAECAANIARNKERMAALRLPALAADIAAGGNATTAGRAGRSARPKRAKAAAQEE